MVAAVVTTVARESACCWLEVTAAAELGVRRTTGGESTTMANVAERWGLIPDLRAFCAEARPVWGTCAGMIFLADRATGAPLSNPSVLCADAGKETNEEPEISRHRLSCARRSAGLGVRRTPHLPPSRLSVSLTERWYVCLQA